MFPAEDEWPIDPREQKLGYRKIMGENDKPKAEKAFLDPGVAPVESEADAYKVWRLQKGIAEGNEIPSGGIKCLTTTVPDALPAASSGCLKSTLKSFSTEI